MLLLQKDSLAEAGSESLLPKSFLATRLRRAKLAIGSLRLPSLPPVCTSSKMHMGSQLQQHLTFRDHPNRRKWQRKLLRNNQEGVMQITEE